MMRGRDRAYTVWYQMKKRCGDAEHPHYHQYGGRGISVCARWMEFSAFYADMGDRPRGLSLDRIDSNGNYCPENCRWTDKETQANNTRSNRYLESQGERLSLSQWARKVGLPYMTLHGRLRTGWPVDLALSEPASKKKRFSGGVRRAEAA